VFIPTTDLIFYCLGTGEYDEMAREWQLAHTAGERRRAHVKARRSSLAPPWPAAGG
jgi:hypothetical protein